MKQKDLVVLVADKNLAETLKGILSRPHSLGLRAIEIDGPWVHPGRDPGCLREAHDLLRPFIHRYAHALVVFDREGCGQEHRTCTELESGLERRLSECGWEDRAAAIVIDPELEAWIWSDSPHVETVLGWTDPSQPLSGWLVVEGFRQPGEAKPSRPKEAVEKALRLVRRPRSSALYSQLATRVSFEKCTDPAFSRLKKVLQAWFSSVAPG